MSSQPILDTWTPYDFKRVVGGNVYRKGWMAPTWVGDERRRLEAYKLIASYLLNAARNYINTQDENVRMNRREYGDPHLLVETVASAILGDDVTIVSEDASDADMEWAQQWGRDERIVRKFFALEEKAVGYGDGVMLVTWDATKERATVAVYDPGFYFPDLETMVGGFPTTICLAWDEEERDDQGVLHRFVRRLKFQLVTTDDARSYPWNDHAVNITCLQSDATWELEDLDSTDVQRFDENTATYAVNADGQEVRDLDLNIDFIPIIHEPNTVAESDDEHYGTSLLAYVLQIFDDLVSSDTDLSASAGIVGFPPIASDGPIAGTEGGKVTSYGPGTVFDGKLSVLDTSKALDALIKYVEHLLNRLFMNSQVAPASVGAVKASDISSGIELRLHFNPMTRMVMKMRLIREEKHPLPFKFARRYAMQAGQIAASSDEPLITVQPGNFVPSDLAGVVKFVAAAVTAHIMSTETAVKMLVDAGVPVEDAEAEVEAIQHENFAGAVLLQQALGTEIDVYKYLGMEIPDDVLNPPPPPKLDPKLVPPTDPNAPPVPPPPPPA